MRKECVESDSQTLTTTGDAEGIKGDDEVHLRIAFQADGENSEYREDETADDLEGCRN
jgi:hypothetical protein